MLSKRQIQVLYSEFLRHSCTTAQIRHNGLPLETLHIHCNLLCFVVYSMRQRSLIYVLKSILKKDKRRSDPWDFLL